MDPKTPKVLCAPPLPRNRRRAPGKTSSGPTTPPAKRQRPGTNTTNLLSPNATKELKNKYSVVVIATNSKTTAKQQQVYNTLTFDVDNPNQIRTVVSWGTNPFADTVLGQSCYFSNVISKDSMYSLGLEHTPPRKQGVLVKLIDSIWTPEQMAPHATTVGDIFTLQEEKYDLRTNGYFGVFKVLSAKSSDQTWDGKVTKRIQCEVMDLSRIQSTLYVEGTDLTAAEMEGNMLFGGVRQLTNPKHDGIVQWENRQLKPMMLKISGSMPFRMTETFGEFCTLNESSSGHHTCANIFEHGSFEEAIFAFEQNVVEDESVRVFEFRTIARLSRMCVM